MRGRKKKEEGLARTHKVQVMLTPHESLSVFALAKAQGVSMSDFVRNMILEKIKES